MVTLLIIVLGPCLLYAQQTQETEPERPNILLIFSDDHAAQAVGAYDSWLSEWVHTPNIDQLAKEGMLFQNAFVTNSICAPSRAVVLTGLHSHITGVKTNRREDKLPPKFDTFPELLQQTGYQTALIGKWHLKTAPQGFDYWEILPGQGRYYNPVFKTPEGRVQYTGYVSEIITDRAIHWLEEVREESEPFLLMYQHKSPHRPFLPAPEQLDLYAGKEIPPPKTLFYDYSGLSSAAAMQEMEIANDLRWGHDLKLPVNPMTGDTTQWYRSFMKRLTPEQQAAWTAAYGPRNERFYDKYGTGALQGRDLTRWKYQRFIKDYLRTVASMDKSIGRMLNYLEENGLADNTVVVYTTDQGFFLGENGWFDKRWIYKESMRIPLIVRWPGVVEPGSKSDALVQNLDFAETFLDIAGVKIPDVMQGRSLVPILKDGEPPADWREAVYYHYYEFPWPHHVAPHEGVRTDRYVLVHYYTLDQWELFDLRKDPEEIHSVYGDPAYGEVTERLKAKLKQLKDKYNVPEVE